jgi:hypothetical protein
MVASSTACILQLLSPLPQHAAYMRKVLAVWTRWRAVAVVALAMRTVQRVCRGHLGRILAYELSAYERSEHSTMQYLLLQ